LFELDEYIIRISVLQVIFKDINTPEPYSGDINTPEPYNDSGE
jgi:hypothetical protein